MTIDVLVVDDEPLARARLRRLVEEEPDLRLIGECVNGEEAVAAIRAASPRLVFLDVDMPDMTGFDVLEAVPATRRPAVVFVTAYDEFAVRAFEVHALDYLLKPFDASRFATTLARVRSQLRSPRDASLEPLAALLEEMRTRQQSLERSLRQPGAAWPERLVVRSGQELVFVRVRDIDWLSSADNYVEIHLGKRAELRAADGHEDGVDSALRRDRCGEHALDGAWIRRIRSDKTRSGSQPSHRVRHGRIDVNDGDLRAEPDSELSRRPAEPRTSADDDETAIVEPDHVPS